MRHAIVCIGILVGCVRSPAVGAGTAGAVRAGEARGTAFWRTLRARLPGAWIATTGSGRAVDVSFREVSRGSALVESFGAGRGHETLTVYHPDGAELMLTHYCAQGNQPRLRLVGGGPTDATFRLVDVTNAGPRQAVLVELRYRLDGDVVERTEVYRQPDGAPEVTVWTLRRTAD